MKRFTYALGICLILAGCGDKTEPMQPVVTPGPVVIDANVNVQLADTPIGARPQYTVTSFLRATQDSVAIAVKLDSITLSYRLNDSPFVVGNKLLHTPFAGQLPFVVQAGDRYTLFARIYASSTGIGGVKASAIGDWNISGVAIAP
ncbi:MAG: hypothetical protein ABIV28_05625 [Longimicrobiales bacterium]